MTGRPHSGGRRRTTRTVATVVGLFLVATSVPCVAMAIHDVATGADNLTGAIVAGSFFAVLLIIGLGGSVWGLSSRRRSSHGSTSTDSLEHRVLVAAKELEGKLTPATLAVETGLSLDEAEKNLNQMVDRGIAETWVSSGGNLVYAFPAFTNPADRLTARDPLEPDLGAATTMGEEDIVEETASQSRKK